MLMKKHADIEYSISCTTRKPRGAEKDGIHYHFLTEADFAERQKRGEFLERAIVHDYHYGTLQAPVEEAMNNGKSIIMDIDVQGAAQIRERVKKLPAGHILVRGFVDIFIKPPSLEELRKRLERRGEDAADVIQRRMKNAEGEVTRAGEYRHVIVNSDLDKAFAELESVFEKEARL
jgi:guanylate kinase